jgi:uncharacterized protein YigE (DUF2233 family)
MSYVLLLIISSLFSPKTDSPYIVKIVDPSKITMHHKDASGELIGSFSRLHELDKSIVFAMNGGMFLIDYDPCGLYVEKGKMKFKPRIVNNPSLNFGMQPQGVFAITKDGKAVIDKATNLHISNYQYATQSAPILVIDGKINPKLTKSKSNYYRNGVGITKDGKVVMALSNSLVTFQQFAQFFVDKGCVTAMYLDGAVSDYWMPGRDEPIGRGKGFGVLIAVHK